MNIKEAKPGDFFRHIRTQVDYIFVDFIKVKLGKEGVWTDCVSYVNGDGHRFARSIPEFEQNFVEQQ